MRQPVTQHLQSGSRETDTGVPLVFLVYFNLILIFLCVCMHVQLFPDGRKGYQIP